jgi:hypothetical protein
VSVTAPGPRAGAAETTRDRARAPRAVAAFVRRHWAILVVLAGGAALRIVVSVAYQPFFWFTDTRRYLRYAEAVQPDAIRPWGYSGFLRIALDFLDRRGVVLLQHALMLALAAGIYAFLVHRRVAPWLAALAVVPLCLSPLVVNIEHHLLADWLFVVLMIASALLLAWRDERPAVWACGLAGLLLALAVVTRQIGLVLAVPAVAYLLVRRTGALRLGAFAVCLAVPVLGYLSWVHSTYGVYNFSTWSGRMLYARVAPIAECSRMGTLTVPERRLCESRPPSARPGPEAYLWQGASPTPLRTLPDAVMMSFARKVVVHQPFSYLRTVAVYTGEIFLPGQKQRAGEACVAYWQYPYPLPGGCRTDRVGTRIWMRHPFSVDRPLAHGLTAYQGADWPIGPLMLACLLVTVFALVWRPRIGRRRIGLDAAFLAVLGLGVTVAAFATAPFSYRYAMPLYATLPAAAALAITRLRSVAGHREEPAA